MLKLKSPTSIHTEVTPDCNHHCIWCYNYFREKSYKNSKPINSEKLLDIADKVIDAEVFQIVITGGEPFFKVPIETLDSLVKKYHHNNVDVSINSNITLIQKEHINFLKENNLTILTSILSDDEKEFDAICNTPGSFKKFCNNLELLSKNNINVATNMVVDKNRINKIYSTAKMVKNFGAKAFCGTRITPSENGIIKDYSEILLDNNDITSLMEQLLNVEKNLDMDVSTLNHIPYCAVEDFRKYKSILLKSCTAGAISAVINSNGDLRFCFSSKESEGNILNKSLLDIWKDVPCWPEKYIQSSSCKECIESSVCNGGCRTMAEFLSGNILGEDPVKLKPLTKKVEEENKNIESVILSDNIKLREEKFGGIFYKQGKFLKLDKFSYEVLKKLYPRKIILKKDLMEIGKDIYPITDKYINNLFYELVENKFTK